MTSNHERVPEFPSTDATRRGATNPIRRSAIIFAAGAGLSSDSCGSTSPYCQSTTSRAARKSSTRAHSRRSAHIQNSRKCRSRWSIPSCPSRFKEAAFSLTHQVIARELRIMRLGPWIACTRFSDLQSMTTLGLIRMGSRPYKQ